MTAPRRWTPEEDLVLERDWGTYNVETIAERLGRTPYGVQARVDKLRLGGRLRGRTTLAAFASALGQQPHRVKRAAKFLGIPLPRAAKGSQRSRSKKGVRPRRAFALEPRQCEALEAFFRSHPDGQNVGGVGPYYTDEQSWEGRPGGCADCGTTERRHKARGLCDRCDKRARDRAAAAASWADAPGGACPACRETRYLRQPSGLCGGCSFRRERKGRTYARAAEP